MFVDHSEIHEKLVRKYRKSTFVKSQIDSTRFYYTQKVPSVLKFVDIRAPRGARFFIRNLKKNKLSLDDALRE